MRAEVTNGSKVYGRLRAISREPRLEAVPLQRPQLGSGHAAWPCPLHTEGQHSDQEQSVHFKSTIQELLVNS